MEPSRFNSEKRDFRRMIMDCPVSYQLLTSPNQKMGTCINLSANGILIECDDNFPVGSKVKISVSPKLEISPSISAILEIVRVEAVSNKEGFKLAGIMEDIH